MKALRFHLVIVVLCFFSFLLLAGSLTFRREFNIYKNRIVNVKDYALNNLGNMKAFKNTVGCVTKNPVCKNGR